MIRKYNKVKNVTIKSLWLKHNINFDVNAIEMPSKHILKTVERLYHRGYANPSSVYKDGRIAAEMVERARLQVAKALGCEADEIFFTSGASESNAWVANQFNIFVDKSSHHSLIDSTKYNKSNKPKIIAFPWMVSETGECLRDKYNLNMEGVYYFVDLTQAIGKTNINLNNYPNIILASASGQKFGGIQGAGILYIKKDWQDKIKPMIYGSQENGLRGGTINVPAVVGFGEAIQEVYKMDNKVNFFYRTSKILNNIAHNIQNLNLPVDYQIHSNVMNITFKHLSSATAVQLFDKYGFNVSSGSACMAGSEEPAQAFLKSGYTKEKALKTIRISVGRRNKLREAKKFVKILKKILDKYDK